MKTHNNFILNTYVGQSRDVIITKLGTAVDLTYAIYNLCKFWWLSVEVWAL